MASIVVTKKDFLNNLTEFIWPGNGRCNLLDGPAILYEPVCDAYTRWIEEWVKKFNDHNPGRYVTFSIVTFRKHDGSGDYYEISQVKPTRVELPLFDDTVGDETVSVSRDVAGDITLECDMEDE